MERVAVIGAGAWGTALSCLAAARGHQVRLWAREPEVAGEINTHHLNSTYLPDIALDERVHASTQMHEVLDAASLVLLVPPAQYLRKVSSLMAPHLPPEAVVAIASKGIEEDSLLLLTQVLSQTLPRVTPERVAVLSGPTFAREVSQGLQADAVAASWRMLAAERIQAAFHAPMFRVYVSEDPVGVQVGAAAKNVIAIAAGICDGLGLGTSARAALMTRGLAEITRLGMQLGADPLTFLGLAGMGDLVLTCTGDLSRNRTLGLEVATGARAQDVLAQRRSVAEGYHTAVAVSRLAQEQEVEMPICEQVFHILHRGRTVEEALRQLLERSYKKELWGIEPEPVPLG